jgi:hypothetical protein
VCIYIYDHVVITSHHNIYIYIYIYIYMHDSDQFIHQQSKIFNTAKPEINFMMVVVSINSSFLNSFREIFLLSFLI